MASPTFRGAVREWGRQLKSWDISGSGQLVHVLGHCSAWGGCARACRSAAWAPQVASLGDCCDCDAT
eukprot:4034589-Pyramimonas_sp.AAC.1